jgi:hypothetical protein
MPNKKIQRCRATETLVIIILVFLFYATANNTFGFPKVNFFNSSNVIHLVSANFPAFRTCGKNGKI